MMRVTTLKVAGGGVSGLLAYYAGLVEDRARPDGTARGPVDYYLDPDEPVGRWWGHGRTALGLDGEVTGEDLRAVLEGNHPASRDRLGRRFGDASARGFDATFSAAKSVSVLWALSPDPWVRAEVLAAHDTAVDTALGWFETHGAVTRRGRDGAYQVDTLGITAAVFRQHTSRSMDPQLHTHAVISAKVQDPSGRWLSLDARFLKYQQRTIGWVYDAALQTELTNRLGVTWEHDEERFTDLTAVPESLRSLFSQRSVQVDEKLAELIQRWRAEHDGTDPDPATIARLERSAAVSSRPGKERASDAADLRAHWNAEARAAGFDFDRLIPTLLENGTRRSALAEQDSIAEALRRVEAESSTWLRADVARHITNLISPEDTASAAELIELVDRLAAEAEASCTHLGPDRANAGERRKDGQPLVEHVTDRRLTSHGVLEQETRLQHWADASADLPPALDGDAQDAAVDAMAGPAGLVVVVGPAGSGKTTVTARAVDRLRMRRRPVIGLAPSGKASDVLAREANCPTDTLAGFLTRHAHQPSRWPAGATVILDEAGMAATEDLARLVTLIQRHRWRLIAVGDPAQLPAVGRGGVFAHWCDTVPHHKLAAPRRFTHEWEAAASLVLRAGDPRAARLYAEHHRLRTQHPALVARDVALFHQHHTATGRTVAVTTATTETARVINREIQRLADPRRRRAGAALADGTRACVGDQIATRRNQPGLRTDRGVAVRNRHTWTVTRLDATGTLTVTHPERGRATLPADYVSRHVELGWAVTGYGNQGDTVDLGIAVLEPSTTRNHAYVAMTRGRDANLAILPDPTGTMDPTDGFADIIARTPGRDSALAVRAQLHRAAGRPEPALDDPSPPRLDLRTTAGIEPVPDDKTLAIQARLDRLQHRVTDREIDRSLGR